MGGLPSESGRFVFFVFIRQFLTDQSRSSVKMQINVVKSALHSRIFYYASQMKMGLRALSLSKNVSLIIPANIFFKKMRGKIKNRAM